MSRLDSRLLQDLNFSGVAISAEIRPNGELLPVAGAFDKLLAAARDKSFPRIHTVVVSENQPLASFPLIAFSQNPNLLADPYADFHILRAGTLAEAVNLLSVDAQTRWGSIDCELPPRDFNFVGRARLLNDVREFIATHDSGYLVIVGGMGKGKSAFLTELIHTTRERGDEPIYHFIGHHLSGTGKTRNIAACLYARLQRKYVFPEPREWKRLEIEDKLERLLEQISENDLRSRQTPEVLYLDAADQVEPREPIVPAALRELPRGVICIITSRARLEWLGTARMVTVWEMDSYVDDRTDVRSYLRRQPLHFSDAFVEQIANQSDPPVFFTVAQRVRQLTDRNQSAEVKALSTNPNLWVIAPQELIETESLQMIAMLGALGFAESQVWQTLGLIAVAREGLSPEQIDAFELEQKGMTDRILKQAINFFKWRPLLRQPQLPYQFDHPGYHQQVLSHLSAIEKANCHHRIATACVRWKNLDAEARRYALRYGPQHFIEAHAWDELEKILCDREFIAARNAAGMPFEVIADLAAGSKSSLSLNRISAALVEEFQKQSSEQFWLQLRNALLRYFGPYSKWQISLRTQLEQSDNLNVMRFLAETFDMEGWHDQAAVIFEKIIGLAENSDDLTYSMASVALATVYDRLQRHQEALYILDKLLSQPGAEIRFSQNYWRALYHRGIILHELGQSDQAELVFEKIRVAMPDSEQAILALHHLGVIELERGDLEQAEIKFKQCLKEQSENEWNHRRAFDYRRLGQVYALTSRVQQARTAFNEAIAISTRCGNRRYVQQSQKDIAKFLVTPYLRSKRPRILSLGEFAASFGIEESYLAFAFRQLRQEEQGYLQVIDAASGEMNGQAVPWEIAHSEGWWHPSVMILIMDSEGNLAWQQRGEKDSRGKWDVSAAGHVDVYEDDVSAALRETTEELGLRITSERLTRVGVKYEFRKEGAPSIVQDGHTSATEYVYRTDKTNRERASLFLVQILEEEKKQFIAGEKEQTLAVKWISLEDSVRAAEREPSKYASSFKQVFGHPFIIERIRETISATRAHSH